MNITLLPEGFYISSMGGLMNQLSTFSVHRFDQVQVFCGVILIRRKVDNLQNLCHKQVETG